MYRMIFVIQYKNVIVFISRMYCILTFAGHLIKHMRRTFKYIQNTDYILHIIRMLLLFTLHGCYCNQLPDVNILTFTGHLITHNCRMFRVCTQYGSCGTHNTDVIVIYIIRMLL